MLKTDRGVSGYVGVEKRPEPHRYTASVKIDGRKVHLGTFPTAWQAALARAQRLEENSCKPADVEAEEEEEEEMEDEDECEDEEGDGEEGSRRTRWSSWPQRHRLRHSAGL